MTRPAAITSDRDWDELIQSITDARAFIDGFLDYQAEHAKPAAGSTSPGQNLDEPDENLDPDQDPDVEENTTDLDEDPDADPDTDLDTDPPIDEGDQMYPGDPDQEDQQTRQQQELDDEQEEHDRRRERDDIAADGTLDGNQDLEPGE